MQTNCVCLDWGITQEYPDPVEFDAFLSDEESDEYKKDVPGRIWRSDSTADFQSASELLAEISKIAPPDLKSSVGIISSCISFPVAIDELGLAKVPDSLFFASISPERVETVLAAFKSVDFATLTSLGARAPAKQPSQLSAPELAAYLAQWRDTLAFAAAIKYGLLGAMG